MTEKSRDAVFARAGYSADRFGTCCSAWADRRSIGDQEPSSLRRLGLARAVPGGSDRCRRHLAIAAAFAPPSASA